MSTRGLFYKLVVVFLLFAVFGIATRSALAQGSSYWSYPQRIPNYDDHSRPPFLVADRNKTIHAFNYQPVDDLHDAIFYRRWSPEKGWMPPVDILLVTQGIGGQSIQSVWLDSSGYFHLVYYDESTIRYSRALAAVADQARSWSPPIVIGEGAGPLASAGFIGDENGRFTVVYCGRNEGIGLYEVHSTDSGASWSEPVIIARIFNNEQWPLGIRMIQDHRGMIHLVWTNVNTLLGLGEEINYTRLESDQSGWTTPVTLARKDDGDYSAHWPAIIEFQNELLLVYQDGFPPTKWMRRSQNSGRTWTIPIRLFPHEGEYEYPVLVVDGSGGLHMLLGNRIGFPATHGMWHSQWINGSWSNPEPVISGPKTPEFDPSAPKAVILQGNILMVTWWNDTDYEHRNGAWYSVSTLNIPELSLQPLPSPTFTPLPPTVEAQATPESFVTSTPNPAWVDQGANASAVTEQYSPSRPLMYGLIPALLVVLLVVLISRFSYYKRFTGGGS